MNNSENDYSYGEGTEENSVDNLFYISASELIRTRKTSSRNILLAFSGMFLFSITTLGVLISKATESTHKLNSDITLNSKSENSKTAVNQWSGTNKMFSTNNGLKLQASNSESAISYALSLIETSFSDPSNLDKKESQKRRRSLKKGLSLASKLLIKGKKSQRPQQSSGNVEVTRAKRDRVGTKLSRTSSKSKSTGNTRTHKKLGAHLLSKADSIAVSVVSSHTSSSKTSKSLSKNSNQKKMTRNQNAAGQVRSKPRSKLNSSPKFASVLNRKKSTPLPENIGNRKLTIPFVKYSKKQIERCPLVCKIDFKTKAGRKFYGVINRLNQKEMLQVARGAVNLIGEVKIDNGTEVFRIEKVTTNSLLPTDF